MFVKHLETFLESFKKTLGFGSPICFPSGHLMTKLLPPFFDHLMVKALSSHCFSEVLFEIKPALLYSNLPNRQ